MSRNVDLRAGVGSALPENGYRPELQALRALAVVAVVINHSWPGLAPGGYLGVDIFFVVSGFLITRQLVRERERTGRIALGRFYLRRARRLLPAAMVVLLTIALLAYLYVPQREWHAWFGQLGASALYVQNWVMAASSVEPTALMHFWSLSVEEQFYLAWPLLVIAAAAVAVAVGRSARLILVAIVVVVIVASLTHWIVVTASNYELGYFSTLSRAWEFAAGGLLALLPGRLPLGQRGRAILLWAGLGAVVASILLVGPDQSHALIVVPVIGTATIIVASNAGVPRSARGLVGAAPVQWLGDISYAPYLWHWPVLIFAPLITGVPSESWFMVLLLALAVALSWGTTRFVENPVRRVPLAGGPRILRIGIGVAVVAGLVATVGIAELGSAARPVTDVACIERVVMRVD